MLAFKRGDVVHLPSGGPDMTVVGMEGEQVLCTYFDLEGNLHGSPTPIAFHHELLRLGAAPTPEGDEAREKSKFGYA